MSIAELENTLFAKWSIHREGFVSDGVANEAHFSSSNPKLMLVMKEVNDPDGGEWDLREFVREGGRPATWDNVTRWLIGINNLDKDLMWKDLEKITEEQRVETLGRLCVMNLKKSPGGHTTDNNELAKIAEEDLEYLNQQFSFYEPDVIICCGSKTNDIFHWLICLDTPPSWQRTKRGIWFHEYKPKRYIVSYSHPEARVQDCLLYYGLVDAIREILNIAS